MALVTKIIKADKSKHMVHKPTTCDYSVFVGDDGNRYIQIDTYGSADRELTDKVSQSIQLNQNAAAQLKAIIEAHFDAS